MDLARSLYILTEFTLEVAQQRTIEIFQTFLSALQSSASQPAHGGLEQTSKDQFKNLLAALDSTPSNAWPPTQRRLLENLGLAGSTGDGLRKRLEEVLTSEGINKALAVQRMSQLLESVRSSVNSATQLVNGFAQLGVKALISTTDECEVAILIPPLENKDSLECLDADLDEFNRLLKYLNELSGERALSPRVTGLASGSWEVYVEEGVKAASMLVAMISGIIRIRREVGSLRKKTEALKGEKGVSRDLLETLENLARTNTEAGLHELAEEIVVNSMVVDDEGRKNELTTAIRRSVRYVAKRLDEGVRVEVSPPKGLSEAATQNREPKDIAKLQATLDALIKDSPMIAKMEEIDTPVLSLPEPDDLPEEMQGSPK